MPPTPPDERRRRQHGKAVLLTILLALATHLLSAQLAHGDDGTGPVTVTLRERASVRGAVRIGDVAEVSGAAVVDWALPVAGDRVEVEDVVRALTEAGVAEHRIIARGPITCELVRGGPEPAQGGEWSALRPAADNQPAAPRSPLIDRLRDGLAGRLGIEVADLRLSFDDGDAILLNSAATVVDAARAGDLGRVAWRVRDADGERTISGTASAEVDVLRLVRPVRRGQTLRAGDFEVRRQLVRRLADRTVEAAEAVGQEAARDLDVGDPIAPDALAARLMVRRGEQVVVTLDRGGVAVRTLATARGDAGYGQVVRCDSLATGKSIRVRVTAPQAGTVAH